MRVRRSLIKLLDFVVFFQPPDDFSLARPSIPRKAGDGNRTHVACLEGRYSTIELHPRCRRHPNRHPHDGLQPQSPSGVRDLKIDLPGYKVSCRPPRSVSCFSIVPQRHDYFCSTPRPFFESHSIPIRIDMGGAGFEPAKALPPDLQSGPFGRLGIHPFPLFFDSIACLGWLTWSRPRFAQTAMPDAELAERLELSTLGLQNRCSAD